MVAVNDDNRIARAYDALAVDYDAQLESNPLAREMRKQLHAHLAHIFRAGDRVLDLTAGTGIDACFLAARGVQVTALDISNGMIEKLKQRAENIGLSINARVLAAEHLGELDATNFDGALSTFAGLNTIEDMPHLARELSLKVKPHGRVLIHALNAFCFWESVAHRARGNPLRARRGEFRVGARSLPHQCFNPYELWDDAFAPYFQLRRAYAMSVIASPRLVKHFQRATPLLFALDWATGRLFPAAGDFFVIELER